VESSTVQNVDRQWMGVLLTMSYRLSLPTVYELNGWSSTLETGTAHLDEIVCTFRINGCMVLRRRESATISTVNVVDAINAEFGSLHDKSSVADPMSTSALKRVVHLVASYYTNYCLIARLASATFGLDTSNKPLYDRCQFISTDIELCRLIGYTVVGGVYMHI